MNRRSSASRFALLSLLALGCSSGGGGSGGGASASDTRVCAGDSDCGGMDCEHVNGTAEGACLSHCDTNPGACANGYACVTSSSLALQASCLIRCESASCASGFNCAQGFADAPGPVCVPASWAGSSTGGSGGGGGSGGSGGTTGSGGTGAGGGGGGCPPSSFQPLLTCAEASQEPCAACLCADTADCKIKWEACEADTECSQAVYCAYVGCDTNSCATLLTNPTSTQKALDVQACSTGATCHTACGN